MKRFLKFLYSLAKDYLGVILALLAIVLGVLAFFFFGSLAFYVVGLIIFHTGITNMEFFKEMFPSEFFSHHEKIISLGIIFTIFIIPSGILLYGFIKGILIGGYKHIKQTWKETKTQ